MEEECHELDLAIREEDSVLEGGSSWGHYLRDYQKAKSLQEQLQR